MTVKQLLISYYPLMNRGGLIPGQHVSPDILNSVPDTPNVEGVMFGVDTDHDVTCVFMMENRSADVAEHLLEWCENDLSWFTLHLHLVDDGYVTMLMPDINRSVERYKTARKMFHGDSSEPDSIEILFKPLVCWCPSATNFLRVADKLGPGVKISVVDSSAINKDDLGSSDLSRVVEIGNVRYGAATPAVLSYIESFMKDIRAGNN